MPIHSGKAYEGTCRIPRQNGDGRGRRLGKKKDSHSVCRGLYMKCLIWEDTWGALGISSANLDSERHFIVAQECREKKLWRRCFVFMLCRCRGYLYFFFTRVPGVFTRVPALYKGAWLVSHFHYRVIHRTLVAQTRQQTCGREFCYNA